MAADMSKACKVGVTTSLRGSTMMWIFYWLALKLVGLIPVRITASDQGRHDLDSFSGFVIGGGDNIGAQIYRGDITLDVKIDPDRDALELKVLQIAEERGMPVLGVCRGAQILNVHRGGNLHQDIQSAYDGVPQMWTPLPKKRVTIEPGSALHQIMKITRFRANSLHRQSINRLGRGLKISATDRYGIVQAVEYEKPDERFLLGVQWHPEFMIYRSSQRRIFNAFKDAVVSFGAAKR
jgi:putative glutamine amidotransferase